MRGTTDGIFSNTNHIASIGFTTERQIKEKTPIQLGYGVFSYKQ